MNGNVFIGWSSSNDLATKIADILKNYRFDCTVGGDKDLEGTVSIANTIIEQIKSATQAMFIIRKNAMGNISNNIMFEIGYCLSKFNSTLKKLHLFYLDIDIKDPSIPSDLLGVWAHHLSTEGKTEEDVIKEIVSKFLSHQKSDLEVNKMRLVNDWQTLYNIVSTHLSNPRYSDYDLAQYMVLFIESTSDARIWPKFAECVKPLLKVVDYSSPELYYITRYAVAVEEMSHRFKYDDMNRYLDKTDSREQRNEIKELKNGLMSYTAKDEYSTVDQGFAKWFSMLCDERIMYYHMLNSNDPSHTEESRNKVLNHAKKVSESTAKQCDELASLSKYNVELAYYYRCMAYRNLAVIAEYEGDVNKERLYRQRSFDDMRMVRNRFHKEITDERIFETRERLYYVSMAELLKFIDDDEEYEDYTDELREYTDKMIKQRDSTGMYIRKIDMILKGNNVRGL